MNASHLHLRLGNGTNAEFWFDPWVNGISLATHFPRLLALDSSNYSTVASRFANNSWSFFWRREPRYGIEVENLESLSQILHSTSITSDPDHWIWKGDTFSVSSTRKLIDDHDSAPYTVATTWCKLVPIKVNIFIWRLKIYRLAIRDNLVARGIDIDDSGCCFCDETFEDAYHLFLHCDTSKQIWSKISLWSNLSLPSWPSMANLWAWIDGVPILHNKRLITSIVIFATLWSIWRLRNCTIFKDKSFRKCHVIDSIVVTSYNWISARAHKKNCNWNHWLQSPLLSL
ncbi:uncharacterized protein [Rutidosis leptorrhynchoides]|uniref:uncharacterized protein n=1 Tax=Rutidosis leptorrhynchoides TaxID=125765 RepID=UPI003A99AA38